MIQLTKDIQLTKHFKLSEFINTEDNNQFWTYDINKFIEFDKMLETLRMIVADDAVGINFNSAYRTDKFNESVGGINNSYHTQGIAVDINVKYLNKYFNHEQLMKIFIGIGFKNIGIYKHNNRINFYHLDIGEPWNGKDYYIFHKKI